MCTHVVQMTRSAQSHEIWYAEQAFGTKQKAMLNRLRQLYMGIFLLNMVHTGLTGYYRLLIGDDACDLSRS